jgi:hypothetical protein
MVRAAGGIMNGGRAIRWSTVAAVAGVSVVAGWVSYDHALAVVRAHGESGAVAWLYPGTIDGLIYSASMVLLDAARRGAPAPRLARWMLAAGIGATLAANVASGLRFGPVGALVAAWPAAAVVGSYELLMLVIRSPAVPVRAADVPADVDEAVRLAHLAGLAAGEPVSQCQFAERFGVSRRQVSRAVAAASNGHGEGVN